MIIMPRRVQQITSLLIIFLFGIILIDAQDPAATITPNSAVTGSLSLDNVAESYTFQGATGNSITITLEGSGLGILLENSAGDSLAESINAEGDLILLEGITLASADTYFITVFTLGEIVEYVMTLDVSSQTPQQSDAPATPSNVVTQLDEPADVLISNGMEVRLQWDAAVDLNLEVRDPRGNTLYYDSRASQIGGTFGFDANGFCEVISEAPAETATWQPGFLPAGSYEILVFYRQSCDALAQAAPFTLTVTVNGEVLEPLNGTIQPPSAQGLEGVYLASFAVSNDGSGSTHDGGMYPDAAINQLSLPASELAASATPIQRDVAIQGAIFRSQPIVTYSFEANADEVMTISMDAASGNLDTLLQLVDPTGNLIAVNDDTSESTNSRLSNIRILQSGTHTIVATRYGKERGGTEGEYQLFLTETSAALPPAIANLNLPSGDIEVFLTWETNADLQLLVRDPAGQSVYDDEPRVNSGGLLAANGNVNCQLSEAAPVSYIYWPLGLLRPGIYEAEVWFQNTCEDTRLVEFTLTVVVNDRVVAVERQIPSIADRFLLTFNVFADGTAEANPGGFISAGTSALPINEKEPLTIQLNQPVNGSITLDNSFDIYAFQGQANQTISVFMEATSQTLDTHVFLIDDNGIEVVSNDDANPDLVVGSVTRSTDSLISSFTLPADGTYRIVATRFGTAYGGTVGTYRLTLQNN